MAKRGKVTEEIKAKAKELLGIEDLSQKELRLIPYVLYVAANEQRIELHRVSIEEIDILKKWQVNGWLSGHLSTQMGMSKEFWLAANELLWLAYVEHDD